MLGNLAVAFACALAALSVYHMGAYDRMQVFSVTVLNFEDSSDSHVAMSVMYENGVPVLNNVIDVNVNRDLQIVSPYKCYFVDADDNIVGTHSKTGTNKYTAVIHQSVYAKHKSFFFVLQLEDSATSMSMVKDRVFVRSRLRIFGEDVAYSALIVLVLYLSVSVTLHVVELARGGGSQSRRKWHSKIQESVC